MHHAINDNLSLTVQENKGEVTREKRMNKNASVYTGVSSLSPPQASYIRNPFSC